MCVQKNPHLAELLKRCLDKICELESEILSDAENAENAENAEDAEAAGYATCLIETLKFLSQEGLGPQHPMVQALSQKLLRQQK